MARARRTISYNARLYKQMLMISSRVKQFCSARHLQGQLNIKCAPFTFFRLHLYISTVRFYNVIA